MYYNQNNIDEAEIHIRPEDYDSWGRMTLEELETILMELNDQIARMTDDALYQTREEMKKRQKALDYYITKKFYTDEDDKDTRDGGVFL